MRQNVLSKFPIHLFVPLRRDWKWLLQKLLCSSRDRLPDGSIPDCAKIIEHVVNHTVPELAHAVPVRGVESFIGRINSFGYIMWWSAVRPTYVTAADQPKTFKR